MDFIIPNCISSFFNIYLSITWTRAIFLHFNGPKTYLVYEYIHIFANFYFLFSKKEHFKLFWFHCSVSFKFLMNPVHHDKPRKIIIAKNVWRWRHNRDISRSVNIFFPFGILQNNSKIVRNIQGHVGSLGCDSTLSPGHSISWLFLPFKTFFK